MIRDWLHDRMPRSLFARAALILLLPVVSIQIVATIAFVQRYYEGVTRQMTRSLVLELDLLSDTVDAQPSPEAALAAAVALATPLEIDVALDAIPPEEDVRAPWDLSGRAMVRTLNETLPGVLAVDLGTRQRVTLWLDGPYGALEVAFDRRRIAASAPHQFLVLTAFMAVVTTAVSYLFLRNQVRPIQRLARAATAYGRGRSIPYRPAGATEVRVAGTAFLDMRNRIERQAQARTAMLAGISHDLRTPLTRLQLGLSMSDDPEADLLTRDVDDMARMIDAFLAFARGDADDADEATDVTALVRDVVEGYARGGASVTLQPVEGVDPGSVPLRPMALRRALDNLLSNAVTHSARTLVTLAFGDRSIRLTVEDDGPGIPPTRRAEALRPFVRLDPARNQDRPGAGLGLAIVADIARAHGGTLRLGRSATLGGLRADLILAR